MLIKCVNKVSYSINKVEIYGMFYLSRKYGACREIKPKLYRDGKKIIYLGKKIIKNEK